MKYLKNKLNSNEGHFMTSLPSFFFSGTGQSLPLWKCYTEALPGRVTSFTWSTASDFSLELISNENSSTTITIIIIMGVRIYYVPIFSKTLFVLTHLNKIVRLLFHYFQLRNTWICFFFCLLCWLSIWEQFTLNKNYLFIASILVRLWDP